MPVDAFFKKVSSMDLKASDENVIYISFSYNREKNTIKYFESLERESHFLVLYPIRNLKKRQGPVLGEYNVTCSMGEEDSSGDWAEKCTGAWSCGKLAVKCLNSGGWMC